MLQASPANSLHVGPLRTREVQPRLRGKARLIRYADDFVICFERREDAERVMKVLPQRMQRMSSRS